MIKELIKLANHLDEAGLDKESEHLEKMINKIAKEPMRVSLKGLNNPNFRKKQHEKAMNAWNDNLKEHEKKRTSYRSMLHPKSKDDVLTYGSNIMTIAAGFSDLVPVIGNATSAGLNLATAALQAEQGKPVASALSVAAVFFPAIGDGLALVANNSKNAAKAIAGWLFKNPAIKAKFAKALTKSIKLIEKFAYIKKNVKNVDKEIMNVKKELENEYEEVRGQELKPSVINALIGAAGAILVALKRMYSELTTNR